MSLRWWIGGWVEREKMSINMAVKLSAIRQFYSLIVVSVITAKRRTSLARLVLIKGKIKSDRLISFTNGSTTVFGLFNLSFK